MSTCGGGEQSARIGVVSLTKGSVEISVNSTRTTSFSPKGGGAIAAGEDPCDDENGDDGGGDGDGDGGGDGDGDALGQCNQTCNIALERCFDAFTLQMGIAGTMGEAVPAALLIIAQAIIQNNMCKSAALQDFGICTANAGF